MCFLNQDVEGAQHALDVATGKMDYIVAHGAAELMEKCLFPVCHYISSHMGDLIDSDVGVSVTGTLLSRSLSSIFKQILGDHLSDFTAEGINGGCQRIFGLVWHEHLSNEFVP